METIVANIELDENLDEETKKQQVFLLDFLSICFFQDFLEILAAIDY